VITRPGEVGEARWVGNPANGSGDSRRSPVAEFAGEKPAGPAAEVLPRPIGVAFQALLPRKTRRLRADAGVRPGRTGLGFVGSGGGLASSPPILSCFSVRLSLGNMLIYYHRGHAIRESEQGSLSS